MASLVLPGRQCPADCCDGGMVVYCKRDGTVVPAQHRII
jgi:hypothetical protein